MDDKKKTDGKTEAIQPNGVNGKDNLKEMEIAEERNDKFPSSIYFIVGNEFCERFCYYGMRAILTLYFVNILQYSNEKATEAFHLFAMFAYFTPLLGAFIADSYLGKYLTILYLSIVYVIGNILISYASYLQSDVLTITGLGLIALGTGGIKPCVSSFGGDQFKKNQMHLIPKFFSLFYLSINLGSLISMFITPIFRKDITCFGQSSCFPLAFGVPALLMIVALLLFLVGTPLYVKLPAAKGNIVVEFVSCVIYSAYKKIANLFSSGEKPAHFLDYAQTKYSSNLIQDSKAVLSVFLLYLPVPIYFSLYDQQGSKWVLQAEHTDGKVSFFNWDFTLRSDQFQVFNPLFIVAMVPLFDYAIYPVFNKFRLFTKPLQKMSIGGLLAAGSFFCAGLLELHIQTMKVSPPLEGQTNLNFILLNSKTIEKLDLLGGGGVLSRRNTDLNNRFTDFGTIDANQYKLNAQFFSQNNFTSSLELKEHVAYTAVISEKDNELKIDLDENEIKPIYNRLQLKIYLNQEKHLGKRGKAFEVLQIKSLNQEVRSFALTSNDSVFWTPMIELDELAGGYDIYLDDKKVHNFKGQGARSYKVIILAKENAEKEFETFEYEWLSFKQVSMLWQLLQYIVITASEIMFSITGLSFSYSEAPISMKSVVTAAWLFTTALGNFLVVLITSLVHFESQSIEFFFYGLLMGLDILLFIVLCYFYKPRNQLKQIEEKDVN